MSCGNDIFRADNPRDMLRLQILLNDDVDNDNLLPDEDFFDESDTDGEDATETRDGDSDTEESGTDEEIQSNDLPYYLGKDKKTKWLRHTPPRNRRTRPQNIIVRLPGVIGEARTAHTTLQAWNLFITDEIIDLIVTSTNQYISLVRGNYSRERDANFTDTVEIKALFGLLYLAGSLHGNRQNLEDLWGTDGNGVEKFRLVMSLRRFKFLIRCLRFDDRTTREERRKIDNLAAVRNLFTLFVENCKQHYSLGANVTIDEKLEAFRGRCWFKQFIPSKPAKYGIKIYAMVDAKLYYIHNLEIYAGKQPEGPFSLSNKPADVVKRLAEPIYNTGRNITADNWFTDVNLVSELKDKKLSYVGTMKKNKPQIPLELINVNKRPINSSIFAFGSNATIVSYVPKRNKNVVVISSQHFDDRIDPESGEQTKPEIITYYNETKSGVDVVDRMCTSYNTARNTRRWPMVIFFSMLNMAGINAQVIYVGNGNAMLRRRLFLRNLSDELVLDELKRRSLITQGMPENLQLSLKRYRPVEEEGDNLPPRESDEGPMKRRRCDPCKRNFKRTRLTKNSCKKCREVVCNEHSTTVCNKCYVRMEIVNVVADEDAPAV